MSSTKLQFSCIASRSSSVNSSDARNRVGRRMSVHGGGTDKMQAGSAQK